MIFQKIKPNIITEAVHSNEALLREIITCRKYLRTYSFLMILSIGLLSAALIFDRDQPLIKLAPFAFIYLALAISHASNQSRMDLLEALAALQGKSMKDDLHEGPISPAEPKETLAKLETLLDDRIDHHKQSGLKGRPSAKEILQDIQNRG